MKGASYCMHLWTRKRLGTQSRLRKEDEALHPSLLDACCRLVADVQSRGERA